MHGHAVEQQHAFARSRTGLDLGMQILWHRTVIVRAHWFHFDAYAENKGSSSICLAWRDTRYTRAGVQRRRLSNKTSTDRGGGKCQTRGSMQGLPPMRRTVHGAFRRLVSTPRVWPVESAAPSTGRPSRVKPRPSGTIDPGRQGIGSVGLKTSRGLA